MRNKLTVTVVTGKDLEVAYQQMAQEEGREAEALAWGAATVQDVADETRRICGSIMNPRLGASAGTDRPSHKRPAF
jgi:hypothetical protein